MALIKSTILAQISGSINGTTFAHNQGGAYARNRSAVTNPKTGRQDQVRTTMSSLSKMWGQSLTEEQRTAWNAYGASVAVINRLGDTISLSGIAAFMRINMFFVGTIGGGVSFSPPSTDPTPPGTVIPSFTSLSILEGTDPPFDVELITSAAATGYGFVLWISPSISPGIRFYRGPYESMALTPGGVDPEVMLAVNSTTVLAAGQSRAMKLTMYNSTSGLPIWTIYNDPVLVPA